MKLTQKNSALRSPKPAIDNFKINLMIKFTNPPLIKPQGAKAKRLQSNTSWHFLLSPII